MPARAVGACVKTAVPGGNLPPGTAVFAGQPLPLCGCPGLLPPAPLCLPKEHRRIPFSLCCFSVFYMKPFRCGFRPCSEPAPFVSAACSERERSRLRTWVETAAWQLADVSLENRCRFPAFFRRSGCGWRRGGSGLPRLPPSREEWGGRALCKL